MGSYIPGTDAEQKAMLAEIGFDSFDELFSVIPDEVMQKAPLALPGGKSELEVQREMAALAAKNRRFEHVFRGAGAYRHFIPSVVKHITAKEEFITSYTPYQAEISQGTLQSIFEFQTMICELTGMDVANASVYDGATAAAEAASMCRERKRNRIFAAATASPATLDVMRTYSLASGVEIEIIPEKNGVLDLEALGQLPGDAACFYLEQPNFYGNIEDAKAIGEIVHRAGARYIMGVYPFAAALLATPGECGADIAVGDGQPLGIALSFGGPTLGFMAARSDMMRKLPGRIVGETLDSRGQRAFVLTLQAREQHIRREKASSNICSNQAHCALTAAVYLSALGPAGFRRAGELCVSKAHYLAGELEKIGFKLKYDAEFFNEFVTTCPTDAQKLLDALAAKGFLGGLPISGGGLLWCATELNTRDEIDELISICKEAAGK
jgi:glycine dehydrogenase subunit 1